MNINKACHLKSNLRYDFASIHENIAQGTSRELDLRIHRDYHRLGFFALFPASDLFALTSSVEEPQASISPPAKSSKDTKDKDLMLDEDMEKDTWNFKSMTDDDPMDFGFEPTPKNKNNAFNLLDDFDLDSSPPKKGSEIKTMDCQGTSSGRKFDKSDALDFDLDSSPPKKGRETMTKTMDCKEIPAGRKFDKPDALDFDLDLPVTGQASSKAKTNVKANASAEIENQISNTTDTMVVDSSTQSKQATTPESIENSEAVESPQSPRLNTSPSKTSFSTVEEIDEPYPANETTASSPLHASETEHTAVNRETSPDIQEICRSGTKEDSPRDLDQVTAEMTSIMESSYEKTEPNISSQLCLDKTEHQQEEMRTDTQAEIQDQARRTLRDQDAGNISSGTRPSQTSKVQDLSTKLPLAPSHSVMDTDTQAEKVDQTRRTLHDPDAGPLSGKISPPTCSIQTIQIQDSNAKLPLASSHSVPGLSDLKATQNKDSGLIRSRFFKTPESHVVEPSPARTESRPDNRERKGLTLNSTDDRSSGIKDALPGSRTKRGPLELVNTDSEKNVENVSTSSSKLDASSLTQKLSKHLSSGAESLQKSKIVSLERPKHGNTMSDLRAAKTQRTIGVYKDQPSSAVQPEVSSSINKEKNTETQVKKSSEIHHLAPRDKTQILQCPTSLKRKALDEVDPSTQIFDDADKSLTPQLKRFSMSPRENRNVEELTHRVAQEKFSIQESRTDNNTTKELVNNNSPRIKSHHQIINMANLEIPITENNDNVEKAEAYTKELENICNILKKKHEEAKELLVRAVKHPYGSRVCSQADSYGTTYDADLNKCCLRGYRFSVLQKSINIYFR
ncbi:unnamed protein product [Arabis nemorensis]|uniref:Uncharacterized protein n=1 Tax=Arabis nemorensis TaxID=586526 RepID=A0A565CFU0_9BRAS|nr:unnamed protein product [Arabis nemorensis]